MEIREKILLFIEIGQEIGLLCHIVFHHFLLHLNGVLHMIYQLEEIMMEMDDVSKEIFSFYSFEIILIADFGLWRPRKNKTYVWEIIPSTMAVTVVRRPWGIAGDIPLGKLNYMKIIINWFFLCY
jgi:hypothetical protein